MKKVNINLLLGFLIILFCFNCGQVPSTDDLDNDISKLNDEINAVKIESNQYSGGLLKILLDIRKEILSNTRSMLEQKRYALKRFIHMTYNIDGKKYSSPENKNEILNNIQLEINDIQNDIAKSKKESDKYSGGLIKGLIDIRTATSENTLAFIKQKELLLKYDMPFYSIIPKSGSVDVKHKFKPTPGKDEDKF